MGTNYYVKFKLTDELKHEIRNKVEQHLEDNDLEGLRDYFEFDLYPNKVHIGKSSMGWQFLFNHNNGTYYQKTRESIDEFIRRDDVVFVNEYEEKVDPEEFWRNVDSKQDDWDSEAYYNDRPEHRPLYGGNPKHDFHENGLRFSTSTQFC